MNKSKESGWKNYYSIANSKSVTCGNMKCYKCKKSIKGDYLIRDRQNFLHRGNETDERYLYHRECSNNKSVWREFDEEIETVKIEFTAREAHKQEILDLMNKYNLSAEDFCDCNNY